MRVAEQGLLWVSMLLRLADTSGTRREPFFRRVRAYLLHFLVGRPQGQAHPAACTSLVVGAAPGRECSGFSKVSDHSRPGAALTIYPQASASAAN